jgi:hypothetical protein
MARHGVPFSGFGSAIPRHPVGAFASHGSHTSDFSVMGLLYSLCVTSETGEI